MKNAQQKFISALFMIIWIESVLVGQVPSSVPLNDTLLLSKEFEVYIEHPATDRRVAGVEFRGLFKSIDSIAKQPFQPRSKKTSLYFNYNGKGFLIQGDGIHWNDDMKTKATYSYLATLVICPCSLDKDEIPEFTFDKEGRKVCYQVASRVESSTVSPEHQWLPGILTSVLLNPDAGWLHLGFRNTEMGWEFYHLIDLKQTPFNVVKFLLPTKSLIRP